LTLFDYIPAQEDASRLAQRRRKTDEWRPVVVDDLPQKIPVTRAEIELIEAHFGPLLDEMFGSAG